MIIETTEGIRVEILDGGSALYDSADGQTVGTLRFEQICAEVDEPIRYLCDGTWKQAPFGNVLNTLVFHAGRPAT